MEDMLFMGFNYDEWMHISAGLGIMLLFLCYGLPIMGWFKVDGWAMRIGRTIGFVLICIPLFTRWFLSKQVILMISVTMVIVSSFYVFLRKRGI